MSAGSPLEEMIGRVLSAGVVTSSICLTVGLLLDIVGARGAAGVMLNIGLVVLLATPVGRVVISVFEYAIERNWLFVVLTAIVLLELMGSLYAAMR